MSERGFSLIELLVATALLVALGGALAAMAAPLRGAFERSAGNREMTGGSRVVLERLIAELREAGSSASVQTARVVLGRVVPTIVPLAHLEASIAGNPSTAVRVTRVPHLAAQGVLREPVAAGSTSLPLRADALCTAISAGCGLRPGMRAVLHDENRAAFVTVQSVGLDAIVRVTAGLPADFPAQSVLAAVVTVAYGLRPEPGGGFRLVRVSDAAEQPLLNGVAAFEVSTSGPDALHLNRVELLLRVEAESGFRGPAGRLFRRAGSAPHAGYWLPDVELRASVLPRNPAR